MTDTRNEAWSLTSELQRIEQDPIERSSLAAAELASAIGALIEQAIDASSRSKSEIAAGMGVTPARVSQLLAGDGNVRVATLARLLNACGYTVSVSATGAGRTITVPRRSRPRRPGGTRQPDLRPVQTPEEFYDVRRTGRQ